MERAVRLFSPANRRSHRCSGGALAKGVILRSCPVITTTPRLTPIDVVDDPHPMPFAPGRRHTIGSQQWELPRSEQRTDAHRVAPNHDLVAPGRDAVGENDQREQLEKPKGVVTAFDAPIKNEHCRAQGRERRGEHRQPPLSLERDRDLELLGVRSGHG